MYSGAEISKLYIHIPQLLKTGPPDDVNHVSDTC